MMLKICLGAKSHRSIEHWGGQVLKPETCCTHSISFERVSLIGVWGARSRDVNLSICHVFEAIQKDRQYFCDQVHGSFIMESRKSVHQLFFDPANCFTDTYSAN